VQNAPPGTTLKYTNVPGFSFGAANAFGVMKCDQFNGNTKGLCSGDGTPGAPNNLSDAQLNALNLSAFGGGQNITFSMPNQVPSKLVFFISVVSPSGVPPVPSVLVQVDPTPPQTNKYYLPHVPSGQPGYVTKITLVNTSTLQADGVVNFIDPTGNFVTSQSFSIPPGGYRRVETAEADRYKPLVVNWAIVGSTQPIGVNVFFEFIQQGASAHAISNAVGTNAPPLSTAFTIPVEAEPKPADAFGPRTVGVAFANPSGQGIVVVVKLLDQNGNVLSTINMPLVAFGQTAFDIQSTTGIKEFLPNANNFKGSLTFASPTAIPAIGLFDNFGPFSATPIFDGKAK
jgi:hypothetical protein